MRMFTEKGFVDECTLFMRDWVKLLSENKYDEACNFLDEPEDNGVCFIWDGESLKEERSGYYGNKGLSTINNPYRMDSERERIRFIGYEDGSGYAVNYDLPIDGEWTKLRAEFSFNQNAAGLYEILFEGVYVA
ncbi:hypothetical protein DXT99_22190 [Pontibacter diazotrophicus]|uniref:Uncharacterized protein n=1 Tax=Pontibacter diazotrophicus TaxID=1400979 RepID=A0A3D8L6F9_9BACT|nr:hypothetical protein [Pontibacter diazotrophicus]RDV12979.1 hypothetical protein DXT99_22190 [Pontibacter diazotrophicus]